MPTRCPKPIGMRLGSYQRVVAGITSEWQSAASGSSQRVAVRSEWCQFAASGGSYECVGGSYECVGGSYECVGGSYESWEQLAELPKMADAAIIATPDQLHTAPALAMMAKGYHILLEK